MDSILNSVKSSIGADDTTDFDVDLIMHINSVLSVLTQLGVGIPEGHMITSASDTWSDFLGNGASKPAYAMIETYVATKVRLIFDPPISSSTAEAMKKYADELEWRLKIEAEMNPVAPNAVG